MFLLVTNLYLARVDSNFRTNESGWNRLTGVLVLCKWGWKAALWLSKGGLSELRHVVSRSAGPLQSRHRVDRGALGWMGVYEATGTVGSLGRKPMVVSAKGSRGSGRWWCRRRATPSVFLLSANLDGGRLLFCAGWAWGTEWRRNMGSAWVHQHLFNKSLIDGFRLFGFFPTTNHVAVSIFIYPPLCKHLINALGST